MLHINLNGIMKFSNMVANILPADLPSPYDPTGFGSNGQNSTILEQSHAAYQIKGNHEFSNMVANILPAYPPPPYPRDLKVKIQLFKTMACCISN